MGTAPAAAAGPLPPPELAGYILGQAGGAEQLRLYEGQGAEIRDAILRRLGDDWSWSGKRVLDFGCGAGRVLRQLQPHAGAAELHGCDIDEACIAWVREHVAGAHVTRSEVDPPLPYPDAHFDFIYATSVFSHLTDGWAAWLLELDRLLAPGGRVLLTVMAEESSEAIAGERWDPDRVGMLVRGYGRPWHAGGPMVLHSPWWIAAHWGRLFEIVAHDPGGICGQDAVLMAKRPGARPTREELRAPEPGEPRELAAALHAIELLQREHAELNAAHDAYAEAYAREQLRRGELEAARARLAQLEGRTARARAGRLLRRAGLRG